MISMLAFVGILTLAWIILGAISFAGLALSMQKPKEPELRGARRGRTHPRPMQNPAKEPVPRRENCPGYDDPEERCPRHPCDCVCWQGRTSKEAGNGE